MKKIGQYYSNNRNTQAQSVDGEKERVLGVLKILKESYEKKDEKLADDYQKKIFTKKETAYILGTASEEMCPGQAEIKDILESDWTYWGDVSFTLDEAIIDIKGDVAWFSTPGTVKYSFEHTQKRYDGYVDFVKEKAQNKKMTAEKRIALINWALTLTYHQRALEERHYYCPMRFSGMMVKEHEQWLIHTGHFSMASGLFPDMRFEEDDDYLNEYQTDLKMFKETQVKAMDSKLVDFVNAFSKNCLSQSEEIDGVYDQYMSPSDSAHIISPETEWFIGEEKMKQFFNESCSQVSLDTDTAVATPVGNMTCITGVGTFMQSHSKEALAEDALEVLEHICSSTYTSQQKLFQMHRQVAYVLKESADGETFTYPMRYSMMINHKDGKFAIEQLHLSYPYYWIFEGKQDQEVTPS